MDATNNADLNKQIDEITYKISEIKKKILYQKRLLDSFDFCSVSGYKSKNAKFISLSSLPKSFFPSFTPYKINTNYIQQQFGLLTAIPIVSNEERHLSCTLPRPFIDEPQIVTDFKTEFCEECELNCVCCQTDDNIWTCGEDNLIRLYNLKEELVCEIPTNSGNDPQGITTTTSNEKKIWFILIVLIELLTL